MLPIWDFLFVALVSGTCIGLYRRIQTSNMTLIMLILSLSFAGIFGQILEVFKISVNGDQLKSMICVSLFIATAFTYRADFFREKAAGNKNPLIFILFSFVFVFGTAVMSRYFAKDQISGTLTQFTYLNAEDNGGWLDVSTKLVNGGSIPFQSVGGPLIALLAVCQSFGVLLIYILTGKKNDLATVLNGVVIAYMVLPLFVAVAFSQITNRFSRIKRSASLIIASCFWLPIYGSLLMAQGSGHLSFIYVTSVYTCCIWVLVNRDAYSFWEQKIAHLCLIATMPVWLPLNVFTVILILLFCFQVVRHLVHDSTIREKVLVSFFVGIPVIAISYILKLSLSYSASSVNQVKGLISAAGGTGSASHVFLVVLIISMLYLSFDKNQENRFNPTTLLKIGISYVSMVIIADYWLTGQMNYGSTKLLFAASIVATPIAAYGALESFLSRRDSAQVNGFASILFAAVCVIGLLDSSSIAVLGSMSPLRWPSIDKSIGTSWKNEILITKDAKSFDDLPVGCITKDDSGDLSVDMDTYSCTRTLLSIGGIWSKGWQLIEFQLWPLKQTATNLQTIDPTLLDKNLLILDVVKHKVVGSMPLSEFIGYLNEHPPLD